MITVQTHRELSTAVAKRLGVRHETPQALLIREGRVVWSASHFRVTGGALESAIKASQIRDAQLTLATIRPSKSPSRLARTSSGPTSSSNSPGFNKKVRIRRLAACRLRPRERLVHQQTTRREGFDQRRKQRSMQIVHDDDHVEGRAVERGSRRPRDRAPRREAAGGARVRSRSTRVSPPDHDRRRASSIRARQARARAALVHRRRRARVPRAAAGPHAARAMMTASS